MKKNKQIIISGFALFSMFFGSGNLIFPPTLGIQAGTEWWISALGFLLTGVGFVMLGVLATTKVGGEISGIGQRVGNNFAKLFSLLIILCIGPGLAIPRTAATTSEVLQASLAPAIPNILINGIFFLLVIYFCLSESKVIDILGKYLTPALLVTLTIIILRAIFFPLGQPVDLQAHGVFGSSFKQGYQTMDCLAALMFTSIVIQGFRDIGYEGQALITFTKKAAAIAGIGLSFIYGGFIYLGATISSFGWEDLSRVELLVKSTNSMLGIVGMILLSMAMTLACLTTAIGLTVTCAEYFQEISKNKLSYKFLVYLVSLVSFLLSLGGVEYIIKVSGPILEALYPVAIILILAILFDRFIKKRSTYIGLVFGALVPVLSKFIALFAHVDFYGQLQKNLAENQGTFLWLVFALAFGLIFSFLPIKELDASEESRI